MKVFYVKGEHVAILFPSHELKQALGVLKALAKHFGAWFLLNAAADLEKDLEAEKQLLLPAPPLHYRLCENCSMEIDIRRKDSYTHTDDSYIHTHCPILKENRPI